MLLLHLLTFKTPTKSGLKNIRIASYPHLYGNIDDICIKKTSLFLGFSKYICK